MTTTTNGLKIVNYAYINGDQAEYTGKIVKLKGTQNADWYEILMIDSRHKGRIMHTAKPFILSNKTL